MWLYLRSPCLCTSSGGVDQKSVWKCQGSGQHWSPSHGSRCDWTWQTSCRIWKWSWRLRRPENQHQFVKTRHGCFWSIIWDIGVFHYSFCVFQLLSLHGKVHKNLWNYSNCQKGNKPVYFAMGTCFVKLYSDLKQWKCIFLLCLEGVLHVVTDENATGTHLQKHIFGKKPAMAMEYTLDAGAQPFKTSAYLVGFCYCDEKIRQDYAQQQTIVVLFWFVIRAENKHLKRPCCLNDYGWLDHLGHHSFLLYT